MGSRLPGVGAGSAAWLSLAVESCRRRFSVGAGLRDRRSVHFMGFDVNPYRYLSRSRVFALTSRFEGFPNALAEAMICGLPVVACDCKTGPREILGDRNMVFFCRMSTAERPRR